MLSEEVLQKLAIQIADEMILKRHTLWVDPETHSEQHRFLQALIEERAEKLARKKAIADKIAGSFILTGLLGLITVLGSGALDWLRDHLK